jgi:steroid 5-alpha reductase family enzyme
MIIIEALLANAAILLGLALILWVLAPRAEDVSFVDAFWGGGIALLALLSWLRLAEPGPLATMLMAMAVLWGVRLALQRLLRWRREGADPHHARPPAQDRAGFALAALVKVFLLQALLMFVVSSPAQYGILEASWDQPVSGLALLGLALFVAGIGCEWIGERRRGTATRLEFIGTACVWWGIWIAAASAGWWVAVWTLIGPILVTVLRSRARR